MKRLTPRQWAVALVELMRNTKESEVSHKTKQFVQVLRMRRASNLLPRVISIYKEIADAEAGIVHIETTAARELPSSVIKELESLGKDVIIDHTIDPHVIGGVRIQMDGVIIDGTVATRLKKIYEN